MESLIVEFDRSAVPAWIEEMVDEFTEDPHCRMVVVGADEAGVVMISMWPSRVVGDVEAAMRNMAPEALFRRLLMSVPGEEG